MSTFQIEPETFSRFPGMRVITVAAHDLDNTVDSPAAALAGHAWETAWADALGLAGAYDNAQSHPRVRPWRERFQAMGVKPKEFPVSIEAILRRAMKGGEPFRISPVVDCYNAVSLRHIVPVGAFDLDGLAELATPLTLRLTAEGDRFRALGEAEAAPPLAVPAGEVAYAAGSTVLSRHMAWRQAREAAITPATRSALFVSEILGEIEAAAPGLTETVAADLAGLVETCFGVAIQVAVLDEVQPRIAWARPPGADSPS